MKKNTLILLVGILSGIHSSVFAQHAKSHHKHPATVPNPYTAEFTAAYIAYPEIPKGLLEAVAFTHTRFHHITHSANEAKSCTGIPLSYTVMGLTLDGKNYFHNNLLLVAKLSGKSQDEIMNSPATAILAYAAALVREKQLLGITGTTVEEQVPALKALSELPDSTEGQQYALNADIYGMLYFLNNPTFQKYYNLPAYKIDMLKVFGADNYKILSAPANTIENGKVKNGKTGFNDRGIKPSTQSPDYGPAIWNPAASCNYASGRSSGITAVAIHDMEGSYAGSISWFQNCSAVVSAHYCLRSSDGQITQMVLESNTAWHVGTENGYTIGLEHEGYEAQTGWYTDTMYATSALLVGSHICPTYGILSTRVAWWPWAATTDYSTSSIPGSCTKIKGHQHYPNQTHTDPGANWDWDYYYKLINDTLATNYITYTGDTGTFTDDGGAGNYNNDERSIYVLSPVGASTVTVNFSSFSTETSWDYMYIYDGSDVWSPLIGVYNATTSPGTITSSGPSLCVEFRSDCATVSSGWNATWSANGVATGIASNMGNNAVKVYPNPSHGVYNLQLGIRNEESKCTVEVYNMLGEKAIPQFITHNSSFIIDLKGQPNGIYFLKVTGEELSYTAKLVKN